MANETAQIFKAIGGLESTMESHAAVHTVILSKLDKMDDKLTIMNGSSAKLHNRMDDIESEAVTKTGVMKAALLAGGGASIGGTGLIAAIKAYLGVGT